MATKSTILAFFLITLWAGVLPAAWQVTTFNERSGPLERRAGRFESGQTITKRTRRVAPVYPSGVQDVTGVVTLQLTVDTKGRVAESRPIQFIAPGASRETARDKSVAQAFVASALEAVNQWEYEPPERRPLTFLAAVVVRPPVATSSPDAAAAEVVLKDVSALKQTRAPDPVYPMYASMRGIQGVIVLEATVAPDGRVLDGRVLRAIPFLDQPALDAMMQWEFDPQSVLSAGQQKNVVGRFLINFVLR